MNKQYYILLYPSTGEVVFWLKYISKRTSAHLYVLESSFPYTWVIGELITVSESWLNVNCSLVRDTVKIKQLDKRRILLGL